MLTGTARNPTDATRFVLHGVAASLGLFGLLRSGWIEAQVVLPFTRTQGGLAAALFGAPALPIEATLACSGADALALCLGAILAYPVRWPWRLTGMAVGAAMIVGLNIVRIGTLGLAAATPPWFNALHLYLWPAALTLGIAGYVFAWMRFADTRDRSDHLVDRHAPRPARPHSSRLFVTLTAIFLLLFVAAAPLYLESSVIAALAAFSARVAAIILGAAGVSAHATGNVLWTPRGGFLVTQECIATPLVPVYLAAVCAYATSRRWLVLGLISALPLFIALGIARLLVVVLPGAIASPMLAVHAFYQWLLAAVLVCGAARWRYTGARAAGHAAVAAAAGGLLVWLLAPLYNGLVTTHTGAPLPDPQGALALLPQFQVGLYVALWIAAFVAAGWQRFFAGLAMLAFTQAAALAALLTVTASSDLTASVRDVRAWAIVGPLLIVAMVVNLGRTRR